MGNILNLDGERLQIKEAEKVVSSTQNQAVVETKSSTIIVSGSEIEVKKLNLDEGEVELNGKYSAIKFSNLGQKKQPLIKRIFK